jgi:hypothetical protein
MKFRYEIDENNAVLIYAEGNDVPVVFQPDYPDTTPWANKTDASNWAKAWITAITDPTAPLPGNSPSEPTIPRPKEQPVVIPEIIAAEPAPELEAAIAAEEPAPAPAE